MSRSGPRRGSNEVRAVPGKCISPHFKLRCNSPGTSAAHAKATGNLSMSEPSRAVFLSYASQDAEAASRLCAGLRAAGIEVWFDQSDLRGGDVWDHKIRQQIHDCSLFIPVISAHTDERIEGYFRLEWKLAVDRS